MDDLCGFNSFSQFESFYSFGVGHCFIKIFSLKAQLLWMGVVVVCVGEVLGFSLWV
jgi:hypothetical protein